MTKKNIVRARAQMPISNVIVLMMIFMSCQRENRLGWLSLFFLKKESQFSTFFLENSRLFRHSPSLHAAKLENEGGRWQPALSK